MAGRAAGEHAGHAEHVDPQSPPLAPADALTLPPPTPPTPPAPVRNATSQPHRVCRGCLIARAPRLAWRLAWRLAAPAGTHARPSAPARRLPPALSTRMHALPRCTPGVRGGAGACLRVCNTRHSRASIDVNPHPPGSATRVDRASGQWLACLWRRCAAAAARVQAAGGPRVCASVQACECASLSASIPAGGREGGGPELRRRLCSEYRVQARPASREHDCAAPSVLQR